MQYASRRVAVSASTPRKTTCTTGITTASPMAISCLEAYLRGRDNALNVHGLVEITIAAAAALGVFFVCGPGGRGAILCCVPHTVAVAANLHRARDTVRVRACRRVRLGRAF